MTKKFVNFHVAIPEEWCPYADELLRVMGYRTRSQFIRELLLRELLLQIHYSHEEGKLSQREHDAQVAELTGFA